MKSKITPFLGFYFLAVLIIGWMDKTRPEVTRDRVPDFSGVTLACYSFSASVEDESENQAHPIELSGSFVEDRFGNTNSAFFMNGIDDYLWLPAAIRFPSNASASLSFWIKTEQTTRFDLFDQRTGSSDPNLYNFGITFNHNDPNIGGLLFCYPLYNTVQEYTRLITANQNNFNDNEWHHFIFIKDVENQKFEIYMDGQLWQTKSIVDTDFDIQGEFLIGKNYLDIYLYHGAIDDIKIFSAALSPTAVTYLYRITP